MSGREEEPASAKTGAQKVAHAEVQMKPSVKKEACRPAAREEAKTAPAAALDESVVMTARQVAQYLHCHYSKVYRLIRLGRLPGFRLGNEWRFQRSDLETMDREEAYTATV